LFAFWAIAGAMTYLLLAHRWGVDEAATRARVALALPFLTDLCLLCGIAWLYARYGTQNLNTLLPILHSNPGWTVRSLVVASMLLNGLRVTYSTFAVAGVAAALVIAPARAAAVLAAASIASAMRTDNLAEMGDAWRRMRATSGALVGSAVVMGLAAAGALAFGVPTRSYLGFALGDAVLLIAIGGLRIFLIASFGPLRRRRAFEPDRVRETPGALGW